MAASPRSSAEEHMPPRAFFPIDAFIADDAEVVFGSPQHLSQTPPFLKEVPRGSQSISCPTSSSFILSKKAIFHSGLTMLLVITNIWNITLALSDIARVGCSFYYGLPISDDLPGVCHPIIPPYQNWPAFKSLEAQVSRHTQQVSSLASMLRKLDDVLGVSLGADRDLARSPQADIITPLTTTDLSEGWSASIWNFFSSPSKTVYLPTVVLDSPPNTGECWQFVGDRGHIAIRLAHSATVTALSIALPPFDELWDEKFQAPKLIHAWGHPTLPHPLTCLESQPHRLVSDFKTARLPASLDPKEQLIFLVKFEYNISEPYSRQIFPVQSDHGCAATALDFVVVEILGNWGADKTCIYHVGIHGQRP